jgi:hypothetical protein
MGNVFKNSTQHIYVVGEVDFRVITLDRPWFRTTNVSLRYPQVTTKKPSDLSINYEVPLTIEYFLIPSDHASNNCYDGMELRSQYKTRIVMLEGECNYYDGYHNMKIIDSAVVPITKNYAMK